MEQPCGGPDALPDDPWGPFEKPLLLLAASQARIRFAATVAEDNLYIAGGQSLFTMLDSVDVLDMASGTWTQLQLSGPRL